MVNECSGTITVLPPAVTEPTLESCVWPTAGIPLGTNGVVAVTVRGGNTARNVHFNTKIYGAICATSSSVPVSGDMAPHVYNVVVPASACLRIAGTHSMSVEMVIEGAAAVPCTGAFVWGLDVAYGSRPGDPKWDAKYDLNKDNVIDRKDFDVFRTICPDFCNYAKFSAAYGSRIGDPNYDPVYDFNEDGVIDIDDFTVYAAYCGAG